MSRPPLNAEGASFLEVGVGVAAIAIEMARLWPSLRVVGIDGWAPALAVARENVRATDLASRIELPRAARRGSARDRRVRPRVGTGRVRPERATSRRTVGGGGLTAAELQNRLHKQDSEPGTDAAELADGGLRGGGCPKM